MSTGLKCIDQHTPGVGLWYTRSPCSTSSPVIIKQKTKPKLCPYSSVYIFCWIKKYNDDKTWPQNHIFVSIISVLISDVYCRGTILEFCLYLLCTLFPPTKQFHAIFHLRHHVFAIIRFTNYTPTLVCAFNTSCFCLLFYHVLWREVGHIYDPLSGISGLLFDSPFPSSLTFFYLVLLLTPSSYGPFSWLFPKFLQHFLSRQS